MSLNVWETVSSAITSLVNCTPLQNTTVLKQKAGRKPSVTLASELRTVTGISSRKGNI